MVRKDFIDRASDFGVRVLKKVYVDAPRAGFRKGRGR